MDTRQVDLGAEPVFIDSSRATWNMDPGLLEELDLDHLGVALADADVVPGLVAVRLHQVPADRCGQHPEVGDVHPGGVEAGDHRALDRPARTRGLAARDHAGATLQRRAERGGETDGRLRRQVDVDEAGDARLAEQAR
jgi:hypothetical protein